MSEGMGVDLGTTWSAVAVARGGRARTVPLGLHTDEVPSVVAFEADGTVLIGEAAHRRAARDPQVVAREFKRRFGDPTPLILGGVPRSPQLLTAELLRRLVAAAAERDGATPAWITVTHPANWGPYKRELFDQALRLAELDTGGVSTLTEPEAAALAYDAAEGIPAGGIVAIYDLGGGTFDAAVVERSGDGFALLGPPEGVESLGGVDFDEAVFGHVRASLGRAFDDLDHHDPAVVAAIARLRRDCVEAKEALSTDTVATVAGPLPGLPEVRLHRAEFEDMIRPALLETVAALRRALSSAGVAPDELSSVLLVGGSSRIPLVAEVVTRELGRRVAVDAHPKHLVAAGAALHAAGQAGAGAAPTVVRGGMAAASATPLRREGGDTARPARRRRRLAVAGLAVAGLTVAAAAVATGLLVSRDPGDDVVSREPDPPAPVAVVIDGTAFWTDTGIDVRVGDVVTIEAAGEVFHNEQQSIGPEGFPNRPELQTPVPTLNHAGLLGRVVGPGGTADRVEGEPFYVGRGTTSTIGMDGRLELGINDGGLENNRGEFTADITVDRGAEPSTPTAAAAPTTAPPTAAAEPTTTTARRSTTTTTRDLPGDRLSGPPGAGARLAVVGVAAEDVLNLRDGPDVSYDVVARLGPTATDLIATGHNRSGGTRGWSEVRAGGATGWVNSAYVAQLGEARDVTSEIAVPPGAGPATTMEQLAAAVADSRATGDQTTEVVVVREPSSGDPSEVTVDVLGPGDDALAGERLRVIGRREPGATRFTLVAVSSLPLCARGVTPQGACA